MGSNVRADELAAVAAGGVVGALLRAATSVVVPHHDPAPWPWATFITNLVGCLVLGVLLDWIDARHDRWTTIRPAWARLARPMLASGVLGGYTTFSTFSVETVEMVRAGVAAAAGAYVVSSVVLGVLLVLVGRAIGGSLFGRVEPDLAEDETL